MRPTQIGGFTLMSTLSLSRLRYGAVISIAVLASGCAAAGPRFAKLPPSTNEAVIYVYRQSFIAGSANVWDLYANGAPIAEVSNGGYVAYVTDPGNVTFSAKLRPGILLLTSLLIREEELITVYAEPGESYYVRFNLGPSMELMPNTDGEREIAELHRFQLSGAHAEQ